MHRVYISPTKVNEVYESLLAANPDKPVSVQQVADALARQGIKNPRTKRAPSRQSIWEILSHADNPRGRELIEQSKARATIKGRVESGL